MTLLFIEITEELPRAASFKAHAYWTLSNECNSAQMSLNEIHIYVPKSEVYDFTFIFIFVYLFQQYSENERLFHGICKADGKI